MKKASVIIFILLSFHCSEDKTEFVGIYKSDPNRILGFEEPMSEKQKELFRRLSWKLIIIEDELILTIGEEDPLKMTYFIEGKCLVGKDSDGSDEFYFPVYFKDRNTAYVVGQTLIRVKKE